MVNYPKLTSGEFTFSVENNGTSTQILLNQTSTGKVKTFYLAGLKTHMELMRISNHMNSLTDDLCSQWFAEKNHGKKEKKKHDKNSTTVS